MNCVLCPRNCNIDRSKSQGYCFCSDKIKVSRASLHMWEEPCISGEEGSGTIFFAGCNMRCVYCQNSKISSGEVGKEITIDKLSDIMLSLQNKGANNINLVTAGHFVNSVIKAIEIARRKGLSIPIVYNTSSYEKVEQIKALDGYVDIYLPDFKYYDDELAIKYSNAKGYREIATMAIDEMVRQCGNLEVDSRNMMKRGVIVRHLVLPGLTEDSKHIIKHLYDRYGNKVYISIMNQFTPPELIDKNGKGGRFSINNEAIYPELNRKITEEEYDEVVDYAIELGVENGFIQEGETASESFIPDFDLTGIE